MLENVLSNAFRTCTINDCLSFNKSYLKYIDKAAATPSNVDPSKTHVFSLHRDRQPAAQEVAVMQPIIRSHNILLFRSSQM